MGEWQVIEAGKLGRRQHDVTRIRFGRRKKQRKAATEG